MTTTSRALLAQGYTPNEIARAARRGELVRLRRGAFLRADEVVADPVARHRLLVDATVPLLAPGAVVSHRSAAVLHGVPVWEDALGLVDVTRAAGSGNRRGHLHVHAAPLADSEVVEVRGIAVTSLARTVVDLGRSIPLGQAVAAGDAALRSGLPPVALEQSLTLAPGRRGIAAARRAVALLDPRSESAGESASRVALVELGLPPSHLQYEVRSPAGGLVGRADFAWEQHRTLGEFDGRVKYGALLRPGQRVEDVVWAEKRREDALRDLGWQVVRWTWADLLQPWLIAERLHRAFRRAGGVVAPSAPVRPRSSGGSR
jgi:hypothetical protein